jgi:hypothetical protein
MSLVFECAGCGHVSVITANPPRCPKCGHGNGVVEEIPVTPAPTVQPEDKQC